MQAGSTEGQAEGQGLGLEGWRYFAAGIDAANQLAVLVEFQFVGASGKFFHQGEHNIALGLN